MDANVLLDKIMEKGLNIREALAVCEKIYDPTNATIADAMWVKHILDLTNREAIELFLS